MDSGTAADLPHAEGMEASLLSAGAVIRRGSLGSVLHVDLTAAARAPIAWDRVAIWLQGCPKLRELRAVGCPIEPSGWLDVFRSLTSLIELDLEGTEIDDRVFEVAAELPKLKLLGLTGTKVTEEALARERRRLIRIRIVRRES